MEHAGESLQGIQERARQRAAEALVVAETRFAEAGGEAAADEESCDIAADFLWADRRDAVVRARMAVGGTAVPVSDGPVPEGLNPLASATERALRGLPPLERYVTFHRFGTGEGNMPYATLSLALGLPVAEVRAVEKRGLRLMRDALAADGISPGDLIA